MSGRGAAHGAPGKPLPRFQNVRAFGAKEFLQGLAVGVLLGFLLALLIIG